MMHEQTFPETAPLHADDHTLAMILDTVHRLDAMSRLLSINLTVRAVQAQLAGRDLSVGAEDWRAAGGISAQPHNRFQDMP